MKLSVWIEPPGTFKPQHTYIQCADLTIRSDKQTSDAVMCGRWPHKHVQSVNRCSPSTRIYLYPPRKQGSMSSGRSAQQWLTETSRPAMTSKQQHCGCNILLQKKPLSSLLHQCAVNGWCISRVWVFLSPPMLGMEDLKHDNIKKLAMQHT